MRFTFAKASLLALASFAMFPSLAAGQIGPVFIGTDPITGLPLYSGSHTIRTARIEPTTPPGQVYGNGAVAGLRFSYVGRTQLAKQYGSLALYHVRRRCVVK